MTLKPAAKIKWETRNEMEMQVVKCGVVWCGVCGVVWCGVAQCGVVRSCRSGKASLTEEQQEETAQARVRRAKEELLAGHVYTEELCQGE
ncbi:hypothetical protein E2C01_042776 [Portunus trituberculatus]|uniref:Uncharacterized protein n=1 Tax=Portunus trituberculatus TaxID=210409 RepID=A0A5B7FUI4_PORTR|nr:hypothetical protein [Portunus trituberculatus]